MIGGSGGILFCLQNNIGEKTQYEEVDYFVVIYNKGISKYIYLYNEEAL